jgi:PAS domain S-box-containing protein
MEQKGSESATFSSLDSLLVQLQTLSETMRNGLLQTRSASIPQSVYEGIQQISGIVFQLQNLIRAMEEERRSLRALTQVGQVINSSLELNEVLQIVMDNIIRLTGAERGFLMLKNEAGEMTIRIARNWTQESIDPSEMSISRTVIYRVVNSGLPVLTTNAQEDPRFTGQHSIVAYNIRSIVCVALKVKGEMTGVIYVDHRIRSALFTQKDLDLLEAFTNQAAVAIENARLFASVKNTLEEVTELKNIMDNVFSSMASGVLTADISERIVLCNRAAEGILGQAAQTMVGKDLTAMLPPLMPVLRPHFDRVLQTNQQVLGLEVSPNLPTRGLIDLRFSLSPLKDAQQTTQGVAIVMEDLTEKRHLEAQRRLFEKMVSPAVIDQLDPNSLQLGGRRAEITVLFSDIRGFTAFSEESQPEELVSVLNQYLGAAADAVLNEEGTVDKFLGDAVMAWFNAPIPQADHTLRAVRAALAIRAAVIELHKVMPPSSQLSFGVGIHTGEAVLGLIGTEKRLEYTAIGDSVNTAKRIQENASHGQILISQQTYERVKDWVWAIQVEPVIAKNKRKPLQVYELIKLR